jgi:hypothetical protein
MMMAGYSDRQPLWHPTREEEPAMAQPGTWLFPLKTTVYTGTTTQSYRIHNSGPDAMLLQNESFSLGDLPPNTSRDVDGKVISLYSTVVGATASGWYERL